MGFPRLVTWHLYIESGPWSQRGVLRLRSFDHFWTGLLIYKWSSAYLIICEKMVMKHGLGQSGVTCLSNNSLQQRHNEHGSVSNHQSRDCLLNRLFRRTSKKTSKLRVTGLCAGNSPVTGEFPAQMASKAENVSIWSRHHVMSSWHWYAFRIIGRLCERNHQLFNSGMEKQRETEFQDWDCYAFIHRMSFSSISTMSNKVERNDYVLEEIVWLKSLATFD